MVTTPLLPAMKCSISLTKLLSPVDLHAPLRGSHDAVGGRWRRAAWAQVQAPGERLFLFSLAVMQQGSQMQDEAVTSHAWQSCQGAA